MSGLLCACGHDHDEHERSGERVFSCLVASCECGRFKEPDPCETCKGSGMWTPVPEVAAKFPGNGRSVCPDCDGTGQFHANGE